MEKGLKELIQEQCAFAKYLEHDWLQERGVKVMKEIEYRLKAPKRGNRDRQQEDVGVLPNDRGRCPQRAKQRRGQARCPDTIKKSEESELPATSAQLDMMGDGRVDCPGTVKESDMTSQLPRRSWTENGRSVANS